MIPIKQYFSENDRKALYALLAKRKQGKIPLLKSLIKDKKEHQFRSDLYGNDFIKEQLLAFFHGKCAYCEDFMGNEKINGKPDWDWETEHYRPKAGVAEHATHSGYYWLAYECTNLLLACNACNHWSRKGNHFPIEVEGNRLTEVDFIENENLIIDSLNIYLPHFQLEQPILLNPVIDTPKDFLEFFADGTVRGKNHRGDVSIQIYGLDRQTLRTKRKKIVDRIRKSLAFNVKILGQNRNEQTLTHIVSFYLKQLSDEIQNPKSDFIAFRCAVLEHFEHFILLNENEIVMNEPFVIPHQAALLKVYLQLRGV